MTTGYRAKSYCIAVGFPHSFVTANQAQKPFNKGALQRDFFRQMRFLLHGSGLEPFPCLIGTLKLLINQNSIHCVIILALIGAIYGHSPTERFTQSTLYFKRAQYTMKFSTNLTYFLQMRWNSTLPLPFSALSSIASVKN